jgi:hypothetical protein
MARQVIALPATPSPGTELARELSPGLIIYGSQWRVIAEAAPQDELVADLKGPGSSPFT